MSSDAGSDASIALSQGPSKGSETLESSAVSESLSEFANWKSY
jgi:hypothetical protein